MDDESVNHLEKNFMDDVVELTNYLNSLPEREHDNSQLLCPIEIEDLHWTDFQEEIDVSDRSIRIFRRKLKLIAPKSRRHQIYSYYEILQYDVILQPRSIKISLAFLFGVTKESISSMIYSYKNYISHYKTIPNKGRPLTLTTDQINQLLESISENEKIYQPMSQTEIVNHIFNTYAKHVSKKWVKRLVNTIDGLSFTEAEPLGDLRTTITKEQISNYFSTLREATANVHPDLIYNVDEIGFSRKLNGKKKKCVIFSNEKMDKKRDVYFNAPVDELSNFTLIASVTLSGEKVKPMLICPVKSCPVDFLTNSIWSGKDCVFGHSESGYNSTLLFRTWFEKVFIPDVNERRSKLNAQSESKKTERWAVLICDGFLGHDAAFIKSLAAQHFIKIVFLPAHSSHFLQALDKYVFATMKSIYYRNSDIKDATDRNGKKISRILNAFYQSVTPMIIRASFKAIGISCRWTTSGEFESIIIKENDILENHQEKPNSPSALNEKTKKRKRAELVNKMDFLANNSQILEESLGICSLCHQIKPTIFFEQYNMDVYKFNVALISSKTMITAAKLILNEVSSHYNEIKDKELERNIKILITHLNHLELPDNLEGKSISLKLIKSPIHIIGMIEKAIEKKTREFILNDQKSKKPTKIESFYSKSAFDFHVKEHKLKKQNSLVIPKIADYVDKSMPGVRGIINLSNCCALCSALQILMHANPLLTLLLESKWENFLNPENSPYTRLLTSLAIQFWGSPIDFDKKSQAPPVNPAEIYEYMIFTGDLISESNECETKSCEHQQYDVLEIITTIISRLNDEFSSLRENPIKKIFYGLEKYEWVCPECETIFMDSIPFNSLSLSWAPYKYTLESMFKKRKLWEYNYGSDLRKCPHCSNKVRVKTRCVIMKLPMVLFIIVPRYTEFDQNKILSVPQILTNELADVQGPPNIQSLSYLNLYGFVNHFGKDNEGHYIAHINVGKRYWSDEIRFRNAHNKWYEFNDSVYNEEIDNEIDMNYAYLYAYHNYVPNGFDLQLKKKKNAKKNVKKK